MKALAWAVLNAEDGVMHVTVDREFATRCADGVDGWHIRPLVVADLDDVEDDA